MLSIACYIMLLSEINTLTRFLVHNVCTALCMADVATFLHGKHTYSCVLTVVVNIMPLVVTIIIIIIIIII